MPNSGAEHRHGWHTTFELEGARVEIIARHTTQRRLPRGHEIARQMSRGRPMGMVEQTNYEWLVLCNRRQLCNLRQNPNGSFFYGRLNFGPRGIEEAAAEAVRALVLRPKAKRDTEEPSPPRP